jgi:hypothetical protein
MRRAPTVGFLAALALVAGCGGAANPTTPTLPSYDADALAAAAIQHLDKNGNATAEDAELDAAPGLKLALGEIDSNSDRKLSADELKARFARYADGAAGGGVVAVSCTVYLDNAPVPNAMVRFEPELFMASVLKTATGTTDGAGFVNVKVEGAEDYGVFPGVYRIVVTRAGGRELPARYNTKSTLGREVFGGSRSTAGGIELRLKSG